MSLTCTSCGASNSPHAAFCGRCGGVLERTLIIAANGSSGDSPTLETRMDAETPPPAPPPPPGVPPISPAAPRSRAGASTQSARDARRPFRINADKSDLTVPLVQQFRFMHEPVSAGSNAAFVGRENELETLAERILFSSGGSFLVTGYRGVGKTSFVNQVVGKLKGAMPWARDVLGPIEIIDIYLNVARPLTSSELMHYIIRRLHDRLHECGIYPHLDPDLQEELSLAHQRTSINMARKMADSHERSFGVNEASLGGDWLKAAVKMSWTAKRSRTRHLEMSYLGYDDKAAEHDILRLADRLARGYERSTSRWGRLWRMVHRVPPERVRLKIIFVFDELDKLEEFTPRDKSGREAKPVIDQILGSLKNLFTTSGISFVFVAGKDLQERWLEDVGRGDSVYESVFAYDKYLPCLWNDVGSICDGHVDSSRNLAPYPRQAFEAFKKYLAYRGRGIPRRIIRTFNEYVEWDERSPALAFTAEDVRRIRFFAGLQDLLDANAWTLFGRSHEEVPGTQSDRRRLGVYYLIDWVLRQGDAEFTLKDILAASSRLSLKVALTQHVLPQVSEEIIRILLHGDYIEQVKRSVTQVFIGTAHAEGEVRYRVTPRRLVEMGGAAAAVDAAPPFDVSSESVPRPEGPPVAIGRYRVIREIGRGGMGVVFEAIDERFDRRVAIKMLNDLVVSNPELIARFEREAQILGSFDHPNIVRLFDLGEQGGRPFMAMELLDGITFEEIIKRRGKLPVSVVADVGARVTDAIGYVHARGYVRNDIKPNNIMLTSMGRVCLLDFGISRPRDREPDVTGDFVTAPFLLVGTPQFMAPEQLTGAGEDERADIYAVGVTLYRMLTATFPFAGLSVQELVLAQHTRDPDPPSRHAEVSAELDRLVLRCLAREPSDRYQSMAELSEALALAVGSPPPADLMALAQSAREEIRRVDALDDMSTDAFATAYPHAHAAEATMPGQVQRDASPATITEHEAPEAVKGRAPFPVSVDGGAGKRPGHSVPVPDPSSEAGSSSRAVPTMLPPFESASTPRPGLVLIDGPAELVVSPQGEPQRAFALTGSRLTLGRISENDVVIRDPSVSRYHAVVLRDPDGWFLEDANSSSGTLLNGERLFARATLSDGDVLVVGHFAFRFSGA